MGELNLNLSFLRRFKCVYLDLNFLYRVDFVFNYINELNNGFLMDCYLGDNVMLNEGGFSVLEKLILNLNFLRWFVEFLNKLNYNFLMECYLSENVLLKRGGFSVLEDLISLNLNFLGWIDCVYLKWNFLERFDYVFEFLDELEYKFWMEFKMYLRGNIVLRE